MHGFGGHVMTSVPAGLRHPHKSAQAAQSAIANKLETAICTLVRHIYIRGHRGDPAKGAAPTAKQSSSLVLKDG